MFTTKNLQKLKKTANANTFPPTKHKSLSSHRLGELDKKSLDAGYGSRDSIESLMAVQSVSAVTAVCSALLYGCPHKLHKHQLVTKMNKQTLVYITLFGKCSAETRLI